MGRRGWVGALLLGRLISFLLLRVDGFAPRKGLAVCEISVVQRLFCLDSTTFFDQGIDLRIEVSQADRVDLLNPIRAVNVVHEPSEIACAAADVQENAFFVVLPVDNPAHFDFSLNHSGFSTWSLHT